MIMDTVVPCISKGSAGIKILQLQQMCCIVSHNREQILSLMSFFLFYQRFLMGN